MPLQSDVKRFNSKRQFGFRCFEIFKNFTTNIPHFEGKKVQPAQMDRVETCKGLWQAERIQAGKANDNTYWIKVLKPGKLPPLGS